MLYEVITNYDLDATGQTLYILGIAQDETERQKVLTHARTISGVRQVVDYIILKPDAPKTPATPAEPATQPPAGTEPAAPQPLMPTQPTVKTSPVEVQPL